MTTEETTNIEQFETTALALREQMKSIIPVKDDDSAQAAGSLYREATDNVKAIEAHMQPQIEEAHRRHKKLTQLRSKLTDPLKDIAKQTKRAISDYQQEQKRKAEEERRRKEEAARKAAEEERLKQAQELEEQGQEEAAEAMLEAPMPQVSVEAEEPTKIDGVTSRAFWYAEIVNPRALFHAYASGMIPIPELQDADLKKLCSALGLNKMATALKSNMNVPGVQARKKMV